MADVFGRWGAPSFVGKSGVDVFMTSKGVDKKNFAFESNYREEKVKARISSFFRRYAEIIYIGMALRFAVEAAKYTPPNMGKAYIDKELYYRPIQDLRLLAKGYYPRSHASRKDYQMLRAGYMYRVMNTKYRHKKEDAVFAYCRGINEAKRLSKIETRGLSKYSWGSMINNTKQDMQNMTGEDISKGKNGAIGLRIYKSSNLPPIFKRLATKSPAISRFVWGTYSKKLLPSAKNVKTINISILNRLTQIQRYGYIAVRKGTEKALKYVSKIWKAVGPMATYEGYDPADLPKGLVSQQRQATEDLRRAIEKLFDDDVKKYGIQQLQITRAYKGQQIFSNHRLRKDINIIFK